MNKLFWVGCFPPECHSVGDHAQTLAVERFLKKNFSDYEVKRFYRTQIEDFFREPVGLDDLIFIHSSGDFGDLYSSWHPIRKKIIARFPFNRVVQLPVSVYYGNVAAFEVDKIFFSDKKNLLILCRTFESANLLKVNFGCRVEFFPDFVFNLKLNVPKRTRKGCLGAFRFDSESLFVRHLPGKVRKLLRGPLWRFSNKVLKLEHKRRLAKTFPECYVTDSQVSGVDITDSNREFVVRAALSFVGGFRWVVSDRFHALVFAYLTKTPFIAVKSRIPQKTQVDVFLDYDKYFSSFRSLVFSEKVNIERSAVLVQKGGVFDAVLGRRSVRKWSSKPVEAGKLEKMLEAAVFAPSAANLQATRFKIVTDSFLKKICCENTSLWFKNSSPGAVVLVCYDSLKLPSQKWTKKFMLQDTSCAMQNMMLVAEELGLKTCWATVNPKQSDYLERVFSINGGLVLVCMLFVGYSDQKPSLLGRHQGRLIMRDVDDFILS